MSIQVTACLNPFSGERKEFSFEQGITINEIIRNLDALNAVNTGWRVMIDDEIITDFERVPEEGQRVYLKVVPEGDNKETGIGMKIGGGLLTVVGVVLAFIPVTSALGVAIIGAGIGVLSGGIAMYNMNIPNANDREKPEQDPSIRGSRNQMRPYGKVPVLLGKRRIYADACANPYTWVDSDGAIWLHQLFCVAQKDIQIDTSTLKIDETLLKDYSATGDISRVLDQSNPDPLIQMKISYGDSTPPLYDKCVHEIQLNTVLKHQTEDEQDGSVIRTTPAKTTKINVDVFFYNGLGKYNDEGNVVSTSVELRAEYKKSTDPDSAYQLLGYFSNGSNTISGSELKTTRYAITKDNLTADSYTVKISRVTADSTDTKIIDTVYVGSIRAANNDTPVRSARCQQVTLIGLKIKASEKLNNIVEQLNFVAQSKMPVYNSQTHQWTNALTSNPASAAMYAMQGEVAQQRLSNSDIDLDSFAALYDWCDEHDYECNAYITDDITINDLLSSIASTCRAEILRMNGKITVIQDIAKDSFVQLFTPRNSHDYKETMALADIPDVLKMGIVDKTNGYAENEVPVYNTPSGDPVPGVEPQTSQSVPLWGVTDSVQARKLGMYNYAVSKHRFTIVSFSCDFEYLMCRKGDWIKYAGDIALAGLKQGRIEAVDGQKLVLDEQVTMENGKSYAIRIRKSDGTAALCNVQTVAGTSKEITISGQIPSNVEGCLFAFGLTGNETRDLIVTDIQCGDNLSADLTCVEYAPEIFGVDDPNFVLPDFVNKLSDIDSVVDPGDVNGWRTFATYNDSELKPTTPAGGGTSGDWHLQQTENSKWISTKTAASIYEGEWSAPMPTGKKVMDVLVPDGEIGDPDSVTGLIAAARQNEIKLEWNPPTGDGIKEGIKTYYVECSKNNGAEWLQLIKTKTNSASYTFNRATDGYPKASVFSTWKFRVRAENIYGKLSSWTETTVNTLGYFTWVPSTPTITKTEADRDGIDIAWSTDEAGRYGTSRFSVFVRYNGADHAVNVNANNTARFNFNRNASRGQDAYPEATDLANWTVKVVHKNESDSVGVTSSESVFTDNYGTWIPATLSFASKIPSEGGISLTWNQATGSGNKQLYGTQKYTAVVKYADSEHSVSETVMGTLSTNSLSVNYYFNRNRNADGYPEKSATATYKGLNKYTFVLKVENESGNAPVSSSEVTFSSDEVNYYKTWIPSVPVVTKMLADENGINFEWDDPSDCYGNNYYVLAMPEAEGEIPQRIDSPRFYYTFLREFNGVVKDGYLEPDELIDWEFSLKAVNNQTSRESNDTTDNVDVSEYLGWTPNAPVVSVRNSGRACTLAPVNPERRYGKIMYKIMVCNPAIDREEVGGEIVYKYYLPTPTSDPFGDEENYKKSPQQQPQLNVPILADSPYVQTMPLKDQTATKYKKYSFKNDDNPLDYDHGTMKLLVYTDTLPPATATQNDVYIDGVLVEDAYCWTDSVNSLNYISFEVSMPSPLDTTYWWKIASYNAITESLQSKTSDYVDAQTTAFATSAYDVVKAGITENALAPDAVTTDKIAAGTITANKIFVEALSAISANLGAITDGSLVGNQNNYWYLSDEYNGTQLVHRAGDFQVGTPAGDYIKCEGYIDSDNVLKYNITMHASKFEITAIGTVVKGELFVCPQNAVIDPGTGIPNAYFAKISSVGINTDRCIIIDPIHSQGNYDEGIRINEGINGWAILLIGSDSNTNKGSANGFWFGVNRSTRGNKLYLNFNSSSAETYFAPEGDQGRVKWVGNVDGELHCDVPANTSRTVVSGIIGDNDYFRLRAGGASNGGWVALETADDGTEDISVAQYTGVFATEVRRAYLLDGNGNTSFPGTVTAPRFNGQASSANRLAKEYSTLDLSGLSESYWYPCILPWMNTLDYTEVICAVALDNRSHPSWGTHSAGFTCFLDLFVRGCGWGTTDASTFVINHTYIFATADPTGWTQMTNSSTGVLWLRGGGIYNVWTSSGQVPQIITTSYTVSGETVSPQTGNQWEFNTAYLTANVPHADNSSRLNGLTADTAPSGNTIALRDAYGYLNSIIFHDAWGAENINNFNSPKLMFKGNDDGYIRNTSPDNVTVGGAKKLFIDNTIAYGASGLQFAQLYESSPSMNPFDDWFSHLIMNHGNSTGYYIDLACCFHSNNYYIKRVVGGVDQGWVNLIHSGNIGDQTVNIAKKVRIGNVSPSDGDIWIG